MIAADLLWRSFTVCARDSLKIMIFVVDIDLWCYGSVVTARKVDLSCLLLLLLLLLRLLWLLWLLLRDEFLWMDLKAHRSISILFVQGYCENNLIMCYFYIPLIILDS
jgi:hypothetical protein